MITANELEFSMQNPEQYKLYRLYEFGKMPRLYYLKGSMEEACVTATVSYRAWVR